MDISSREILEEALSGYGGTCLFISHDRFFINKVSSGRYLLKQGYLIEYSGDYTNLLIEEENKNPGKLNHPRSSSKDVLSKNRLNEQNRIELDIRITEDAIRILDDEMMELLPLEDLEKFAIKRQNLQESLDALYEKWASITQ